MAVPDPPGRYISLAEAIEKPPESRYSVIGICVDYLPPARSRGSDHTMKFTLLDPSWGQDQGMNFRFFHKTQEGLPTISDTGDIVILKNVATKCFGATPFGISNYATSWYVLSGSSIRESTCAQGSDINIVKAPGLYQNDRITISELNYAKALVASTDPGSFSMPAKPTSLQIESIMRENGGTPPARKDKWYLLKDLELDKHNSSKFSDGRPAFADLFGEVRRLYTGDYSCVDLYLTDYTTNSRLYNYEYSSQAREGDEYGYVANTKSWQGPWGQMTIKVFLWDAHGMFIKTHVKERMFVLIKNCHIKVDPNGSKLEAVCRGDRNNASKVNVTIFDPANVNNDERFEGLLQRRKEYKKSTMKQGLSFELPDNKKSIKHHVEEPPKPAKMSKSKRKKLNKIAQQQAAVDGTKSSTAPNQHIRCNNIEVPTTTIDKMLDLDILKRRTQAGNEYYLPFQNAAYKCNVRVVNFYPDDIARFAVPCEHFVGKVAPFGSAGESKVERRDVSVTAARRAPNNIHWEWRFMLVIEDATSTAARTRAQVAVLVAGQHGDCLLKEDACDLEYNSEVLARLKEKLFLMWGDLQEKKEADMLPTDASEEQSRSRPFECLIQEYGMPMDALQNDPLVKPSYKRLFQMFGTTII